MAAQQSLNALAGLETLLAKVEQVAVLPHVVFKVLEITATNETSPLDVERAVTVDPGFSSKVLTMANSPTYGLSKRVTSIKDAVMFLGLNTVRGIALTVGLFDLFVGKTDRESLRRREWWRHSIDSAVCARWLASQTKGISRDEAYTCGLLHLIGKTLLDRVGKGDYEKVSMLEGMGVPDIIAERKVFGFDHVAVGVGAAKKWGLPIEVRSGINYVLTPANGEESPKLRASTALATRIALCAREGSAQGNIVFPHWALDAFGFSQSKLEKLIPEGVAAITAAQATTP